MKITSIRRFALPVAAACALLGGTTASAQAGVTTEEWMSVDGNTLGPFSCSNGETVPIVTLFGSGHALMTYSPDATGGYSLTVHANFADVTGTDTSGDTYQIPTVVAASTTTTDTNLTKTATVAGEVSLISTGSAPNLVGHFVMHITFDANGVPTATVNITAEGCLG